MTILVNILFLLFSNGDNLDTMVYDYLSKNLTVYDRFTFRITSKPGNYDNIVIDKDRDFKVNRERAYVPVIVNDNGKSKRAYVSLELKLFKKVVIASKEYNRGDVFMPNFLKVKLEDVSRINGDFFSNIAQALNYQAKNRIRQNEIILLNDTDPIPLINPGDKIKASVIEGSVVISLEAVAKQAGGMNDIIKIRTVTDKYFRAKVLSTNEVLIVE